MTNVTYVGRQSIFDINEEIFAFELLYREGEDNFANITDHNLATAELLNNVFTSIGLEHLVGDKPAFVNMPRDFLLGDYPIPELTDQLVIEILEHVEPDAEVIAALSALKQKGYLLALDDYVFEPHMEPFLALADIIKLDIMQLGLDGLAEKVEKLRPHNVRLLAEKVETAEEVGACRQLGFDYFQGYYFSRPKIVSGRQITGNQIAVMQMLTLLNDPNVDTDELSELVQQDIAVSYKLLRYMNSAMYSFSREIESIREAIVMLGQSALVKLVNMVAIGNMEDINNEAYRTAMFRARMCETIALELGHKQDVSSFFLVGLFSNLDALLGVSMDSVLKMLPLADDIRLALTEQRGRYGETLACVLAYEGANIAELQNPIIDNQLIVDCYIKAINWADSACDLIA